MLEDIVVKAKNHAEMLASEKTHPQKFTCPSPLLPESAGLQLMPLFPQQQPFSL